MSFPCRPDCRKERQRLKCCGLAWPESLSFPLTVDISYQGMSKKSGGMSAAGKDTSRQQQLLSGRSSKLCSGKGERQTMALKRMFSREITDSDAFLDLSLPAQCLYFHACLAADDEGFISAGKRIARAIGATEKELDELVNHGFLIFFPDSGVYVAAHFWVSNNLRSDRFHETVYQAERKLLERNENNVYQLRQPVVNQLETNGQPAVSSDKSSSGKEREEKESSEKVSVREESPEGGDGLKPIDLLLAQVQHDGITREIIETYNSHGYDVTYSAYNAWREDGKVVNRYNDYVKQILKGEKVK